MRLYVLLIDQPDEAKRIMQTAGTLVYALPLLAAFPHIQAWVAEQVDKNFSILEKDRYSEAYPKLVRCLAVMVCLSFSCRQDIC